MSDIRKTLDKLNEMTAGSVATVATPLFKETVKREKTDETADSGKKYMNSVERGASEWGNWAGSKKKKTVAEATTPTTDDDKFKTMLKKVTSKKEVKKQQKADTKQQASDAFASMFGGGNPAGTLGIRKEGVAEGSAGNWYVRVRGKVLKDKQFNAIPFSSEEAARTKAMEIYRKKRIPLEMIKITQSWMDGPETQGVAEGAEFGAYYSEKVAKEIFNKRQDITSEDEILNQAYHIVSNEQGQKTARYMFNYDEDFPSDVVSNYFYLQKQGVAEGLDESWKISTPIDKERYTDMSDQGLEGPFRLKSGKIVYYDPKEGKYYDRDTDMYMDYDEYQSHTNEEALMELGYEGNIGAMEMVKFFKMADPRQKEILNQLIKEKEFQRAWALIQGVTGDKLVGKEFSEGEIAEQLSEDLRAWFGKGGEGGAGGGGWDRYNTKGERIGKCGERKAGEGKPKCLSKEKAASLRSSGGKKAIAAAVRKKRREDPNPQRQGAADMVSNKTKNESLEYYVKEGICPQCNGEMVSEALFTEGKKDACYHKVKSRYKIWPSAYGSGALVKCRKAGAKNWGNKSKNESINEGRTDDLERALMQARKITKGISYDTTVNEIMVAIEELVKSYNLDMDDFNYHNSRVYEAKHELESAIYGLDEIFEDALRDAQYSDEESINEADPARRGFLGSLGKAAAAGAAMAAGGKALGQEKRSVNISVEEADNQIKALRNQAYQDLASMLWSVWPYILDKKFGNLTPEDDIPNAEEIGKIISNRIGRKLEEYAKEYRKKVHMIKVNAGITDPNTLYKTSAMLESLTEEDLSEQDLIVMPGKMRMRGDVVKAKHMEPDHEVSMAVNSLLSTVKSSMSLAKIIKGRSEGQGLPGWVSDHITRADELIKDVAEYMEGHEAQKNMLEGKKNVKR
jgi:hypothetical protein